MMKRIVIILEIIVVFSACVSQVNTDPNNGLVINELTADKVDIEAGKEFRVYIDIENVGGKTAERIEARLYGLPYDVPAKIKEVNNFLKPPDISRNKLGESFLTYWDLTAPELAQGLSQDYNIKARVYYDYSTSAALNIPVYSEDEYNRLLMLGESFDSFTVTNSDAPVKVDVLGDYTHIEVRKVDSGTTGENEIVPYQFVFRNVGSGIPMSVIGDITGLVGGEITVSGGAKFMSCLGQQLNNADKVTLLDVRIREGNEVTLPCTLIIDRSEWTKSKATVTVLFDLTYRYYVEESLPITVTARRI